MKKKQRTNKTTKPKPNAVYKQCAKAQPNQASMALVDVSALVLAKAESDKAMLDAKIELTQLRGAMAEKQRALDELFSELDDAREKIKDHNTGNAELMRSAMETAIRNAVENQALLDEAAIQVIRDRATAHLAKEFSISELINKVVEREAAALVAAGDLRTVVARMLDEVVRRELDGYVKRNIPGVVRRMQIQEQNN